MPAIRERPVQRYAEIFGLGTKRAGFIIEIDFQFTFGFLVVEMEDCRQRFCSSELQRPGLQVFTSSCYGSDQFDEHYFNCLPQSCKRTTFWTLIPGRMRHLFLKPDFGTKANFSEWVKICPRVGYWCRSEIVHNYSFFVVELISSIASTVTAHKVCVIKKKFCTQALNRPEIFWQLKPDSETRPYPKSPTRLTILVCQSPSLCIIAWLSVYAYFLEKVIGKSEV